MRSTVTNLIFFAACAALLFLGVVVGVERGECVKLPEEFYEPDPKPTKPKPAKPRKQSSEDSDSGSGAASRSSSGRFSKDGQGIIKDKQTGLQWYMGPENNTTWYQAQSWVQSQSVGGGGWRMPTRSELAGLSAQQSDGCYLETIFSYKDRCIFVWSGEIRDSSSSWGFTFYDGREGWDGPRG